MWPVNRSSAQVRSTTCASQRSHALVPYETFPVQIAEDLLATKVALLS